MSYTLIQYTDTTLKSIVVSVITPSGIVGKGFHKGHDVILYYLKCFFIRSYNVVLDVMCDYFNRSKLSVIVQVHNVSLICHAGAVANVAD